MAAGRYEQALDWAERTLREEPGYRRALATKAIGCAHLDQVEGARAALAQLIEVQPELSIAGYSAHWSRVFSPEVMAITLTGLRKAGLPEE